MQMLKLGGAAAAGSDNESVTSLEYHKPNNSTIGMNEQGFKGSSLNNFFSQKRKKIVRR